MIRHLMTVMSCLAVVGLLATCGLGDLAGSKDKDKKDATTTSGSGACFVAPAQPALEPGSTTTASAVSGFDWTDVNSLTVDGQTLNKNVESVTLAPKASRRYAVLKYKQDGTTESCTFDVEVGGTSAGDLACTVVSDPASLPAGGDLVTVSLQVSGTKSAVRTSINGDDLSSAVGGSKQLSIFVSNSIVGRVEAADGQISECTVDVKVGGDDTTGEYCKSQPSTTDLAALAAKDATYEAANDAARDAALAADATSRNLTDLTGVKTIDYGLNGGSQIAAEDLCAKISAAEGVTGACSAGDYANDARVSAVRITIGANSYDVYAYATDTEHLTFKALPGGDPAPVLAVGTHKIGEKLPLEVCQCDDAFNKSSTGGVASDMAPPAVKTSLAYLAAPAGLTAPAPVKTVTYSKTVASFEYTTVQPAAGQKAPQCDFNQAT